MVEKRGHPLYRPLKRLFGRKIKWAMETLERENINIAEVMF